MYDDPTLYTTTTTAPSDGGGVQSLIGLALLVVMVVALWRVFTKAGKPGWAAIIPFYNAYVLTQIVGRPVWWFVMLFIPLVNIVFSIIMTHDLSKSFGRGVGTTLLLIFFPYIMLPILGFGSAQYVGPAAAKS